MALLHSWDFSVDPHSAPCQVHGGEFWTEQSYSVLFGGTDRITAEALGGVNWSRQEVRVGDNQTNAGTGGERADLANFQWDGSGGSNGMIRSYRQLLLLRPAVDYDPTDGSSWNDSINFHTRVMVGWPSVDIKLLYAGKVDTDGSPHVSAVGDLMILFFGGRTASKTNVTKVNKEDWRFLAAGAWEGKAIDIAMRVKWAANEFDAGAYFFQSWNGGVPTNLVNSGWIELQYRLGTVTSSIAWGAWTWFDPTGWTNGPDARRHYRPMLFWYDDTGTPDTANWKMANYRGAPGDGTSVIRHAQPKEGETFTDVGAPEVSGAPATADPTEGPFGTTDVIDAFTGGDLDPLPAPWTDDFSGGTHPSWKRASNAAAPSV